MVDNTIQPWIRKYQYIRDYYETVYNIYTEEYPGYPINFYTVDWENSIYDRNLMGGSYAKMGVGELSGIKWKKILLLPVYAIEQIQPENTADEKGVTMIESERTSCVLPSTYGLKPCEWDIVHFHQDFMFPNKPQDIEPLFIVQNVNLATYGEMTHYQMRLKVAPFKRDQLEKQISSYHMFLEFTHKIHDIDVAAFLLKLQNKNTQLANRLKDLFHDPTGLYLILNNN